MIDVYGENNSTRVNEKEELNDEMVIVRKRIKKTFEQGIFHADSEQRARSKKELFHNLVIHHLDVFAPR